MYKRLDLNKLNSKKFNFISSEDALKDMTPISWSKEVLSGKKKVTLQEMLDRISEKADTLTGENGVIELDPDDPFHREWFEIDKYKGE